MRTLANDTTPEMEETLVALWRRRTPAQKLSSFVNLRQMATRLVLGNLRKQFPNANEYELTNHLHMRRFGQEIANKIRANTTKTINVGNKMLTETQIIKLVTDRLDALKIPYFISGSIASIAYGEERLTKGADLVVRIFPRQVKRFVEAFETDFVVSVEAVQDAIDRRFTFNIIHINSAFKMDFYPISDKDKLEIDMFARRQREEIGAGEVWLASAEDIILAKLRWFKKGGEASALQWRDVLGVLKVQAENLDFAYLEAQAKRFGFADLLARARDEA